MERTLWTTSLSWWIHSGISGLECWLCQRQTSSMDGCGSLSPRTVSVSRYNHIPLVHHWILDTPAFLRRTSRSFTTINMLPIYFLFLHVSFPLTGQVMNNKSIFADSWLTWPSRFEHWTRICRWKSRASPVSMKPFVIRTSFHRCPLPSWPICIRFVRSNTRPLHWFLVQRLVTHHRTAPRYWSCANWKWRARMIRASKRWSALSIRRFSSIVSWPSYFKAGFIILVERPPIAVTLRKRITSIDWSFPTIRRSIWWRVMPEERKDSNGQWGKRIFPGNYAIKSNTCRRSMQRSMGETPRCSSRILNDVCWSVLSVSQQYVHYQLVSRLFKRWLSSQLLLHHVDPINADLLCCYIFLHAAPYQPPK